MDVDNNTAFNRLVGIMDELREKCPWDKKQTIQSLRQLTIEETYELADSITDNDWNGIKEELGDIMLHLVFYAENSLNSYCLYWLSSLSPDVLNQAQSVLLQHL